MELHIPFALCQRNSWTASEAKMKTQCNGSRRFSRNHMYHGKAVQNCLDEYTIFCCRGFSMSAHFVSRHMAMNPILSPHSSTVLQLYYYGPVPQEIIGVKDNPIRESLPGRG